MLSQIRRVLLHVDHRAGVDERIIREVFCRSDVHAFTLVVPPGEGVAVYYTEYAPINVEVHSVFQIVLVVNSAVLSGHFMPLKEDALGDSSVLNALLHDVHGVVFEVEEQGALANAEILVRRLHNWLLEEAVEVQNLHSLKSAKKPNLPGGRASATWVRLSEWSH